MTRLALSDENSILNRLGEMEKNLYYGTLLHSDVEFSVKTIRNLLLELYLTRSSLDEDETDDLITSILAKQQNVSTSMRMFESNKPI